jgi:hypothetical protein
MDFVYTSYIVKKKLDDEKLALRFTSHRGARDAIQMEYEALLAEDEDWLIRSSVAKDPNTSPETLDILASDEDSYACYWVTTNPNYGKNPSPEFNFDEWLKTASIEELEEYGRPLMEMNKKNNIFSWLTKQFKQKTYLCYSLFSEVIYPALRGY